MVVATTYAANFFVGHEREVDGALELLALLDQLAQRHNVLDAHALVRTMTGYRTVTGMVSPRRQENACGQGSSTYLHVLRPSTEDVALFVFDGRPRVDLTQPGVRKRWLYKEKVREAEGPGTFHRASTAGTTS